jgi:hypothetical protein
MAEVKDQSISLAPGLRLVKRYRRFGWGMVAVDINEIELSTLPQGIWQVW